MQILVDINPNFIPRLTNDSKDHIEVLKIKFNRLPDFYDEVQKMTSAKDTQGGLSNIIMTAKKDELNYKLTEYLRQYDPDTGKHFYNQEQFENNQNFYDQD